MGVKTELLQFPAKHKTGNSSIEKLPKQYTYNQWMLSDNVPIKCMSIFERNLTFWTIPLDHTTVTISGKFWASNTLLKYCVFGNLSLYKSVHPKSLMF